MRNVSVTSFDGGMNGAVGESLLPIRYASEMFNMDAKNGELLPGMGVADVGGQSLNTRLAEVVSPIWMFQFARLNGSGFREDYLLVLDGETNLIAVDLSGNQKPNKTLKAQTGLSRYNAVNYNLSGTDVVILSASGQPMLVWDGVNDIEEVADAPNITSMVVHYERLFITSSGQDRNTVWFSDNLNPTNFTLSLDEAGYIQMADDRGACLKAISFLDYVYVFREYGIARISGYGDQTQFLVSQVCTLGSKIEKDTITICGNVVLFLAEDGIYSFNGLTVKKILPKLAKYIIVKDNTASNAAAFVNDKWYLACSMKLSTTLGHRDQVRRVLLEYDLQTGNVSISDELNATCLCALKENGGSSLLLNPMKLHIPPEGTEYDVLVYTTHIKKMEHNGLGIMTTDDMQTGYWQSPWTTLGMGEKTKQLRKVGLTKGKNAVRMIIESDSGQKQEINFATTDPCVCSRPISVSGKRIRFVLYVDFAKASGLGGGSGAVGVSNLTLTVS